jgi:SAM-dependent methyltransferase
MRVGQNITQNEVFLNMERAVQSLPMPFCDEKFHEHQRGVYGDSEISVYLNALGDFAFLYPQSDLDYSRYEPRVKRLGLEDYRKRNQVAERRFEKIEHYFGGPLEVLEIGSYDGAFVKLAKEWNPLLDLGSLETDDTTKPDRDKLVWLKQYSEFRELFEGGLVFDLVCFFHVLEHIIDPATFLNSCSRILRECGKIIVEVPSLDDPLLKLYACKDYERFFFQSQHPYVYSKESLRRLLKAHGFDVQCCIPHQRYGLENHLTWLTKGEPGGDETLRTIFSSIDAEYRRQLETSGQTDAVIVVAEKSKD